MKTNPYSPSGNPFPMNTLPDHIAAMVRSVATVYGVPEVMPAVCALAMLSAALGKGLRIASGRGRQTMGNIFVLISADSGTGKSSVLRILREPLDIIEAHLKTFPDIQGMVPPEGKSPADGDSSFEGFVGFV